MNNPPIRVRDFVSDPVTPNEVIERFWDKVDIQIQGDVEEIVYDLISDYDLLMEEQQIPDWFDEDDTDEKDSLRFQVLEQLGFPHTL